MKRPFALACWLHGWLVYALVGALVGPSATAASLLVDRTGGDFTDIQTALDAAEDGDVVVVGPGEYAIDAPLDFNRLHDPEVPSSPPRKDLVLESRDGPEATTIRMADAPKVPQRAGIAVFESGEGDASRLVGFTLTGGRGTGAGEDRVGGGISCVGSSPRIEGCVIRGNEAHRGGGIYCRDGGSPAILDCIVTGNRAPHGGGIACEGGSGPLVEGSSIDHNDTSGILVHSEYGEPQTQVQVRACRIFRNRADADYGGGGGISVQGRAASAVVVNSAMYKNEAWASGYGGALEISRGAEAVLDGCTIVGNAADGGPGGVYLDGATVLVMNTILWGNGDNVGDLDGPSGWSSFQVYYSIIEGEPEIEGVEILRSDPRFVDPAIADFASEGGDFHLAEGSPAVDAGTQSTLLDRDIDGEARSCGAIDIGADERCGAAPLFRRGDCNGDGTVDVSDGIRSLGCMFLWLCELPCEEACDSNDDGTQNVTDAIYTINYLFLGTAAPPAPGPRECGPDPEDSPAHLECGGAAGC